MVVKANTKKAEELRARARYNEGRELYQVYGNVSSAKMKAMEDCKRWYLADKGENFRIISHNSFQFSVAWEFQWTNPESGEVIPATRIETASNSYIVPEHM